MFETTVSKKDSQGLHIKSTCRHQYGVQVRLDAIVYYFFLFKYSIKVFVYCELISTHDVYS